MAEERGILDISDNPDLLRIPEGVRRSKMPCVLRAGDEDVLSSCLLPVEPSGGASGRRPRRTIGRSSTAPVPRPMWTSTSSSVIFASGAKRATARPWSYELSHRF